MESYLTSPSGELLPSASKRLMGEISELDKCPVVNASASPLNNEILSEWHCTVIPQDGAYRGVPIHFILEMPPDYPNTAPSAFFHSDITYHGGAEVKDAKGRKVLCLDLFGNFASIHTEWGKDGEASGWTTSYDISQILVNVQAVLAGQYLSSDSDAVARVVKSGEITRCSCGHSSGSVWPPVLPTEDALARVLEQTRKESERVPTLCCYSCKTEWVPGSEEVMGYGVNVRKQRFRTSYSTPAEPLSLSAFRSGVRSGTRNQPFTNFMPIFVNEEHWSRSKSCLISSVNQISPGDERLGRRLFRLLAALMSDMVVQVMRSPGVSANDKFIEGYFVCYRVLAQVSKESPDLVAWVETEIEKFCSHPKNRNKKVVPDLGQWLILLQISEKYQWKDVSSAFVGECETRNVFWYCVGNRNNPARYPALRAEKTVPGRERMVFDATKVSRDLVCFQTRFLSEVKAVDLEALDANNGVVQDNTKEQLKEMYKEIEEIDSWNKWFEWNEMPPQSGAERERKLIEAVRNSRLSGYHRPK